MTDEQGNSATMQGIRILQSWNCVLEDCKVVKIIDIAMLRCWQKAGKRWQKDGVKPPRPVGRKSPRQGAKAMRRIRRSLPDREKGKFIEANNQRYDRERLCQSQQQKIPRKEH